MHASTGSCLKEDNITVACLHRAGIYVEGKFDNTTTTVKSFRISRNIRVTNLTILLTIVVPIPMPCKVGTTWNAENNNYKNINSD